MEHRLRSVGEAAALGAVTAMDGDAPEHNEGRGVEHGRRAARPP